MRTDGRSDANRLERAASRIRVGKHRKALAELWYAEAEHRADAPRLREALSLAHAVAAETHGRTRSDADILIGVLSSDIERAESAPRLAPNARAAPLPTLRLISGVAAVAAVVLFVSAFLVMGNVFEASEARADAALALFFGSCAAAALSLACLAAWAGRRAAKSVRQRRNGYADKRT